MLLKDKIALVTGSTHNIGLAIARAFAREGAKVIVHSRHEADAKKIEGVCFRSRTLAIHQKRSPFLNWLDGAIFMIRWDTSQPMLSASR